jgi:DSF synthase
MSLLESAQYQNLSIYGDANSEALFMSMNVRPRPCFTWDVIRDLMAFQKSATSTPLMDDKNIRCLVWASETKNIFSLGGDLAMFQSLIKSQDRAALAQYAEDCVTVLHQHLSMRGAVTVSLLEGDALGAGLEVGLSSDIVIAERGIRAGFPEVLFNLVPGHGAYYLLARRIGPQAAEKMIRDGTVHTAEELHALGLIDVLVEKGGARQALRELMQSQKRSWNAFQALQHIKRNYLPITREALSASAQIWVEAAMCLTDRNLRMMERLVSAQEKRAGLASVVAPNPEQESQQKAA